VEFQIKNYRGITDAGVKLDKIAAVFGPNGAGKSSIAGAAKALLASDPMASSGVNKRDALQLVNESAREARAVLEDDNGTNVIEWPSCEVETTGEPPRSSAVALGILDVLTMEKKKRDQFFDRLLGATPSVEELGGALEHLMDGEKIYRLLEDLKANGWDAMSKHYGELATQKKGAWKQITGQNWGSAKASNYVPDHWSPDLERASHAQLQAREVEATAMVEGVAASNAIDDAELDALTEEAKRIPKLEEYQQKIMDQLEEGTGKLQELLDLMCTGSIDAAERLAAKLDGLPLLQERSGVLQLKIQEGQERRDAMVARHNEIGDRLSGAESMPCPKCGAHLVNKLGPERAELEIAPPPPSEEELGELATEANKLEKSLKNADYWIKNKESELKDLLQELEDLKKIKPFDLQEEIGRHMLLTEARTGEQELNQELGKVSKALELAQEARNKIQDIQSAPQGTGGDINSARESLRMAQEDLAAWKKKKDADQVAKTIDHYLESSKILGPSGLRKKVLGKVLQDVNKQIASWSPWSVMIKNDLSFTYDGRPVALCCESERWRASTVIQILVALRQEDAAIVIDRADILDNKGKNRLFRMLVAMPFRSLVLLKADNRQDVFDLRGKGIGFSYWVEYGSCSPV
jgi:hypothetical protein